jgi:hypothetical protein
MSSVAVLLGRIISGEGIGLCKEDPEPHRKIPYMSYCEERGKLKPEERQSLLTIPTQDVKTIRGRKSVTSEAAGKRSCGD